MLRAAARCRRVPFRRHQLVGRRCDHRLASTAASGTPASPASARSSETSATDEQVHWTLFSELDLKSDADKLHLGAFIDALQGSPARAKQPAKRPEPAQKKVSPRLQELRRKLAAEAAGVAAEGEGGSDQLGLLAQDLTPEAVEELLAQLLDGYQIPSAELKQVLRKAATALSALPTVVDLPPLSEDQAVTIVGDIHGQLIDLEAVFESAGTPSATNRYVFNGNYVNRGEFSLEVLVVLLGYALALPGSVHLNRGNHEDRLLSQAYGLKSQLEEKYGTDAADIFADCVAVFQALPLAATLREPEPEPEPAGGGGGDGIVVLHAGLPDEGNPHRLLADIAKIDRSAEGLDTVICGLESGGVTAEDSSAEDGSARAALYDILWSNPDPYYSADLAIAGSPPANAPRGQGRLYSQAYAMRWMESAGVHTLIRSHQVFARGAVQVWPVGNEQQQQAEQQQQVEQQRRMHSIWTVFSASNYPNHGGMNDGAVLKYRGTAGGGRGGGSLREPEVIHYRTEEPGQFHRTSAFGKRFAELPRSLGGNLLSSDAY